MNYGIDISSYQEYIDFNEIKSNYSFVIARAGFTGYGGDGTRKYKDQSFEKFYTNAKNLNIPIGVYYYSCANTYDKGRDEAEFLYENALKGKKFEYPIYMDVEENRHQMVGKTRMAEAIKGFCEYLEDRGYYVGVYANSNYFYNYIDTPNINMYDKWLAVWTKNKPNFRYGYGMWQNSNSGYVSGYRVDTDVSYRDYPNIIMSNHFNGYTDNIQSIADTTVSTNLNIDEIVRRVLQGEFGNGEERKDNLERIGYNYYDVQRKINELYASKAAYNSVKDQSSQTYIVKSGDTLWSIAQKYLGDGNKYIELANKNNIVNPRLIYSGQKLTL